MTKQKKLLCSLAALSLVLGGYTAPADAAASDVSENMRAALEAAQPETESAFTVEDAEEEGAEAAPAEPAPITLVGDDIFFDEKTGDVYAKGNVVVKQAQATLYADDITGNTKSQEIAVEDKAKLVQPGMDLDGYNASYNYGEGEGTMDRAAGRVGNELVHGETIEFYPDSYIIYNGSMTKCPAKKPDYYTRAKKIEIWPDEKLIAYDAQFVLKGVPLYSTKRYETKIGKDASENPAFPRVGYNSDDGVYVKQRFQQSFTDNIYGYVNANYYTKQDFKPMGGIVYNDPKFNYSFEVSYGYDSDSDDNWIKKKPEYKLDFHNRRIGNTPWSHHLTVLYGLWEDDEKKSWHEDYELYFARDPIHLTDSWTMNVGAGYEIMRESYNNSRTNTITYDASLSKRINDRMNAWTGYHHSKADAKSIFDYGSDGIEDKLTSGFSYRFDNKNSMAVSHVLDLEKGRTTDLYYTLYHNLHCWNAYLTYHRDIDEHDNSISFQIETAHW